jgi:ubiquinone/menaquinone biosynthesis C-methylase UbiE
VAQNIYDRPDFFAEYSRLERSVAGLAGAAEWPSIQAMLPDMTGLRVVDLGCGFGWFCRWARDHGAASVLGLDLSDNMLDRARSMTTDPAVTYKSANLEHLDLPIGAFNLAYSSLALHYIPDLPPLLATVYRGLVPGGRLVFSIEHPIMMAPTRQDWSTDAEGRPVWPIEGYLREGARTSDWLAKGVVKYHRMIGTTINHLIDAGFSITHVEEYGPSEAQVAARPEWAKERERPIFLLVAARR